MTQIRDTSHRRLQISELVRQHGSVQVTDLAKRFNVSMQTVRKDLRYLSERGIMARAYGGAIVSSAVSGALPEPAYETKRSERLDEKKRIGRAAAAMVRRGDTIALDSGTTTTEIADALPDIDITVVTNDFGVLTALTPKTNIQVVLLGGQLRRKNMAFYGGQTVNALDDMHVDKLFLGVDGFDLDRGVTTHYEPEAQLNRKMVEASNQVIAVTDSSKFGRVCLHRIIAIADMHALITDDSAPDSIRQACAERGVKLHLV